LDTDSSIFIRYGVKEIMESVRSIIGNQFDKYLDLYSGEGNLAMIVTEMFKLKQMTALESDIDCYLKGKQKFRATPSMKFILQSATASPHFNEKFDLITAIPGVANAQKCLTISHKYLEDNGFLVLISGAQDSMLETLRNHNWKLFEEIRNDNITAFILQKITPVATRRSARIIERIVRQPPIMGQSTREQTESKKIILSVGRNLIEFTPINESPKFDWSGNWSGDELDAVEEELRQLLEYQVLEPLNSSEVTHKTIDTLMLTTRKVNSKGEFIKWKGRLVARGDHTETSTDNYAPTSAYNSFILTLNHAAINKFGIDIIDIKGAYLHSDLEDDVLIKFSRVLTSILVRIDPNLVKFVSEGRLICKLRKALYGLRQSAIAWYKKLAEILTHAGFTVATYDAALFTKKIGNEIHLVDTHSDDLISVGPDESRAKLHNYLRMELGNDDVTIQENVQQASILGLWLERQDGIIELSCPKLLDTITTGIERDSDTPYTTNFGDIDRSEDANLNDSRWFKSTLMKINFLLRVRPEVGFDKKTPEGLRISKINKGLYICNITQLIFPKCISRCKLRGS